MNEEPMKQEVVTDNQTSLANERSHSEPPSRRTAKPSAKTGKLTLAQALTEANTTQILTHFKKLAPDEVSRQWNDLSVEAKESILDVARSIRGKKATEQQIALAHDIAATDAPAATRLLLHALADAAQARQQIGKLWFVESRSWVGLGALSAEAAERILPALIDAATEPSLPAEMQNKTKSGHDSVGRKFYDFSRWVIPALAQWLPDERINRAMRQRLIEISPDWPDEWRNEIQFLADSASPKQPAPSEDQPSESKQTEQPSTTTDEPLIVSDHPIQQPDAVATSEPSAVTQGAEKDLLVDRARGLIQLRQEEIAQKQAEIETLNHFLTTLLTARDENAELKRQVSNVQEQVTRLQNANAQLESRCEREERLRREFEMNAARLNNEAEKLREDLAAEKSARASEQQWVAEQIEREIKYELDGFRQRLSAKLSPVFAQKRCTDPQPADAELAEFLRRWFQDIEDKLQEQGVSVRRD